MEDEWEEKPPPSPPPSPLPLSRSRVTRLPSSRLSSRVSNRQSGVSSKLLSRAKTVASGLGSQSPSTSGSRRKPSVSEAAAEAATHDDLERRQSDGGRFQVFCRGSLKRLQHAGSKVQVAKRDMEDMIETATKARPKSEGDVASEEDLSTVVTQAYRRLEKDAKLAVEAEQEMSKIISQFADLLREEEERLEVRAEQVALHSANVVFDHVKPPTSPRFRPDGLEEENHDHL